MTRLPEALVVIDPHREKNAVNEARKLGIKVVALIDTDCDPDLVDLPIPGNDDSMRSIELVIKRLTDAIIEGRGLRPRRAAAAAKGPRPRDPEASGATAGATVAAGRRTSGRSRWRPRRAGSAGARPGPSARGPRSWRQGAEVAEQEPAPAEPAEIAPAAVEAAIPGSGGETDIPPSAE